MIGVIDVQVQAANPQMPLWPMRAFKDSPTSIRVRNVPKRIGEWHLNKVYFAAAYPDNSIKTADCVLIGNVWVGTIAGSTSTGTSQNGYTIFADGIDENGNAVTGYVLGKGDIEILENDGTITPSETSYYVHLLSAQSDSPKEGDLYPTLNGYMIWQDGAPHFLAQSDSQLSDYYTKSETSSSSEISNALSSKAFLSSLNDYYMKSETSSANEILNALSAKQDKLDDMQMSSIGYGINELQTKLDFGNGDVSSFNWSGLLTFENMIDAGLFDLESYTWIKQPNSVKIGSAIDSIGGAFNGMQLLTHVEIPSSVKSMENSFSSSGLRSIEFPYGMNLIGLNTFYNCSSLTSVFMPETVEKIAYDAFNGCSSLSSIQLPEKMKSIGSEAFSKCGFERIEIPEATLSIYSKAFNNCTSLKDVVIGSNVSYIEHSSFAGCTSLSNVIFKGKSLEQVQGMYEYPWGITDTSIIKTWNAASEEYVDSMMSNKVDVSSLNDYKTYSNTLSSLSNDGYATTTYAVNNVSGVAKIQSISQADYDAISSSVDLSTLYVIPEEA